MRNYPRADMELEGGVLATIFDLSISEKNGAKVENTFRQSGAGISFGPVNYECTFKLKMPTDPAERDWIGYVRNLKITQIVLKFPDGTQDTVDGAFSDRDGQQGLEGAMEQTMKFVGVAAPAPL